MDKKRSKASKKTEEQVPPQRLCLKPKPPAQIQSESDNDDDNHQKISRPSYVATKKETQKVMMTRGGQQQIKSQKQKKMLSGSQQQHAENIGQKYPKFNLLEYKKLQNENKKLRQENQQLKLTHFHLREKLTQQQMRNKQIKLNKNKQFTNKLINIKSLYYSEQNYSTHDKYLKMLKIYANSMLSQQIQLKEQIQLYNEIDKIQLKIKIYQVYNSVLKSYNQETQATYTKVWELFYRDEFFSIIDNNDIKYFLFKMWNQNIEKNVREIMLRMSIQNVLSLMKMRHPNILKRKKKFQIYEIFGSDMVNFTQLIVKQPLIFYSKLIKTKLLQTIEVIKQSWYIKAILSEFLIARRNYIVELKKIHNGDQIEIPQITNKQVENKLKLVQVFFVDYPSTTTNGFTFSIDNEEKFPIIINLFVLHQFFYMEDLTKCLNFAQSYLMYVFLHELAHSLIRKLSIIKKNENSIQEDDENIQKLSQDIKQQRRKCGDNLKNIKHQQNYVKQKMDTGFLFELYSFGNYIQQCYEKDYKNVEKLLQIKNKPRGLKIIDICENFKNCSNFLLKNGEQIQHSTQVRNTTQVSNQLSEKQKKQIRKQTLKQIRDNQKYINELNTQKNKLKQKIQSNLQEKLMQVISFEKKQAKKSEKNIKEQTQKNSKIQKKKQKQIQQKSLTNLQIEQLIQRFQKLGTKEYKNKNNFIQKIQMRRNLGKQVSMPIGCCNIYLQRMRQHGFLEN